jgi:protein-tyrosine phosphatase
VTSSGPIPSILVVCDGNHCRSPIAEALFREGGGARVEVGSAGLTALEGVPPDETARMLLAEHGVDISGHRGRQFTPELALAADLVLVMESRQKAECERLIPSTRGRVFLLGNWRPEPGREIPDPFRKGPDAFNTALEQISRSVQDWLQRVIPHGRPS